MKLLLTSYGLTNKSIVNTLTDLVGKEPIDTKIAFIPTAAHGNRGDKNWVIDNLDRIKEQGYHIDIVELTAHEPEKLKAILCEADVIFVGGGNGFYLSYWMQKKGLFEFLPELLETKVYASISAGSMIAADSFRLSSQALEYEGELTDDVLNNLGPVGESSAKTFKFVDFVFKPHFNNPEHIEVRNEEYVRSVANRVNKPIYVIDDQSALKVIDGNVEVISEGNWLLLNNNL
jgi:dipeptidase E